jgi:outer membrane lipoprotein-sorting protein
MNIHIKSVLFCILTHYTVFSINAQQPDATLIIDKMIEKNKTVNGAQFQVIMSERIDGEMYETSPFFKIQVNPRKIYLKEKTYGMDINGIYIEGVNNNKARMVKRSFPVISLDLDPYGDKMRDKHHHTIFEAGFSYFIQNTENYKRKYGNSFGKYLNMRQDEVVDGKNCWVIEYVNPKFGLKLYTAKKGESLISIAKQLYVNDYMILKLNPGCSDYYDVSEGQKLTVPNDYAKRIVLYIDKEMNLPLRFDIYDDKGLYAKYIYKNLIINPAFSEKDFSYNTLFFNMLENNLTTDSIENSTNAGK